MAGTNLLQWNPTASNQETDSQYSADSQRSGGAVNPSEFDATLANKLFYQITTYLTALFTAFANKGYATSDSDLGVLTAQCANFLTTADVKLGLQQVPYSSTLVLNCTTSNGFQISLAGDVTSLTLQYAATGQRILLAFTQDSAGNHSVTWPSNVIDPGTVSGAPNSNSVQEFIVLADTKLHPITAMAVS